MSTLADKTINLFFGTAAIKEWHEFQSSLSYRLLWLQA